MSSLFLLWGRNGLGYTESAGRGYDTLKLTSSIGSQFAKLHGVIFLILGLCVPVLAQKDPYTLPLRFRVLENGVKLSKPKVDYDLTEKQLVIGDQILSDENLKFAMGELRDLFPKGALSAEEKKELAFVATWPEALLSSGVIEFISRSGEVLAQFEFAEKDKAAWKENLKTWKIVKGPLIGIRDLGLKGKRLLDYQSSFRVCASATADLSYTRLCSREFIFREVNKRKRMEALSALPVPLRVILQQEEAPLKDVVEVDPKEPVQFFAGLASGWTYEFGVFPEPLNVVDMTEVGEGRIRLVSDSVKPTVPVRELNPDEEGFLTRFFMWQQTIGDFRKYWQLDLKRETPSVFMPGQGGGIFRYDFDIEFLPTEDLRLYIYKRSPDATYVDGPTIEGVKPKGVKLTSKQNKVKTYKNDEFDWNFQALKRGEYNQSEILIESKGKTYKAYYELYKGYPRELSARLSGVVGTGGNLIANGELAFNYWFEDIFGWTNYWLSRQRWGASVKTFRSLNEVKLLSRTGTLESTTADLKYRLSPGLWGRDESWGLIAGYNQIKYNVFHAGQTGFGFFWARSMPKIFDEIFNIVPIMRYPKWVDLEVIYYTAFTNPDESLPLTPPEGQGNWALNFHGKVLWSKNIFGEAGFGIRQYDWIQFVEENGLRSFHFQFTSFYGTMGLGYSF